MASAARTLLLAALAISAAWSIAPARATAATPGVLELTTVPVLPGAELEVGGVRFVTDEDGNATVNLPDMAEGVPPLKVIDDASHRTDQEIRFSRWWGVAEHGPNRKRAKAVFDVYQRVTWSYVEADGRVVDPSTVSKLVVRSSHGNIHEFGTPKPVWLHAERVVPSLGGLITKQIDYRIESVLVDGAEVVIRAQQSFTPARQPDWQITLLFFNARFSAFDAALGSPLTGGIRIEYPSKRVVRHELDARGELNLRLPRGTYRALVEAPGMQVWTPVALSRDQSIPIKVLTYVDMGLGAAILAGIALGLLFVGRPHLVLRRPAASIEPAGVAIATAVPLPAAGTPVASQPANAHPYSVITPPRAPAVATAARPPAAAGAPGGALSLPQSERRPALRAGPARAATARRGAGALCPNGCPPSSPGAQFCRYCGTPRTRPGASTRHGAATRPATPAASRGTTATQIQLSEGGHG